MRNLDIRQRSGFIPDERFCCSTLGKKYGGYGHSIEEIRVLKVTLIDEIVEFLTLFYIYELRMGATWDVWNAF